MPNLKKNKCIGVDTHFKTRSRCSDELKTVWSESHVLWYYLLTFW